MKPIIGIHNASACVVHTKNAKRILIKCGTRIQAQKFLNKLHFGLLKSIQIKLYQLYDLLYM
jgi:hypothetical protein